MKVLEDQFSRDCARRMRDQQWGYMERMADGTLYVRLWNKHRKPDAPDVLNLCLMGGMDLMGWVRSHRDWFEIDPWHEEMCADPFRLTDAGRKALSERELYENESHHGGLVGEGYLVTPSAPNAVEDAK